MERSRPLPSQREGDDSICIPFHQERRGDGETASSFTLLLQELRLSLQELLWYSINGKSSDILYNLLDRKERFR